MIGRPSLRRRVAIILACLVGGAVWPLAWGNALLVGIAGCEEPGCGDPALYQGLFVVSFVALALAMAGIASLLPVVDGRRLGLTAAITMAVSAALVVIGVGILIALLANVVFARDLLRAKVYSAGAARMLVVATVGHVVAFGVLLFPFAWLWLAISVGLGPSPQPVAPSVIEDPSAWASYGLGVWRVERSVGLPGIGPGDVLGIEPGPDEVVFLKPRVGRVAGAQRAGLSVTRGGGEAVLVTSTYLELLITPLRAEAGALLALDRRGNG